MASSPPQKEQKRMGTASHLLTPEEPSFDCFEDKQPARPVEPRSPPESPAYRPLPSPRDRVLYPGSRNEHTDVPLFETTPRTTPELDSSSSTTATSQGTDRAEARHAAEGPFWSPLRNPAPVSTGFVGVVQQYNADPVGWYKMCMAQNVEMQRVKAAARQLPPPTARPATRDSHTQRLVASLGKSRVVKSSVPTAAAVHKARADKVLSPPQPPRTSANHDSPKGDSPIKRASRQASTPAHVVGGLPHANAPKPRTRQPPSKVVERKDQHWTEIVDRCPPKESLDTMSKRLTVEWSNKNHQDLSQDPDRAHLHPQELEVASTLRLKCDRYLLIKRLIFQEKVKFLQESKEFNKTSAQNCCNVDVNKISKLWQGFHDAGWFERHWFEQYLN